MISSLRNFAKTKLAGILVFIMIIPFVFWGMGSMFSSGNTNTIAKVNNTNISTQEFIDHLNTSGIPQETIRENLENNIIEELLSNLVSTTLLDLEVKDFKITISERTLLNIIKNNKNFLDENGTFQRVKYEKFLLENNQSAPSFELRLMGRELQKNLFDYIGAGTLSPKFLANKLYIEENKKVEIDYIDLNYFYKKKENFSEKDLKKFIEENKDQLKVDYLDFEYAILNPKNLVGVDEFNQSFFDKIDQIEIDISNDVEFENILSNFNIKSVKVNNFLFSSAKNEIEKKIFELRNNKFDLIEDENNYVLYKIRNIQEKNPDINDLQTKNEILELIYQKNKFEYNKKLLEKIRDKKFNENNFIEMGKNKIETTRLNSVKDNKIFQIDAVEILYSLPINSFTLINDEEKNVYLAKINKFETKQISDDNLPTEYIDKQNSKIKNNMLKSYDFYLNTKYEVVFNEKTIERVKNFFQ